MIGSMLRSAWLAMAAAGLVAAGCGDRPQFCQLEPIYGLGIQMEPDRPPFVPGRYRLEVTADGEMAAGEFEGLEWAAAESESMRRTLDLAFEVPDPEVTMQATLLDNLSFIRDASLILLVQRTERWGEELVSAGPINTLVEMYLDDELIGSEDYDGEYELEESRGAGCGFYGATFGVLTLDLP